MNGQHHLDTGVTAGAVLAYLQREADLDGLVTVSQGEVAAAIGCSQPNVGLHIRNLAAAGLIAPTGRVQGVVNHAIVAYQLSEEAMA